MTILTPLESALLTLALHPHPDKDLDLTNPHTQVVYALLPTATPLEIDTAYLNLKQKGLTTRAGRLTRAGRWLAQLIHTATLEALG